MESLPSELGVYLFSHAFLSLEEQRLLSHTTSLFRHWIRRQQVLVIPKSKVGTPSLLEAVPDVRGIRGYLQVSSLAEVEEATKELAGSVRILLPLDPRINLKEITRLVGCVCQFIQKRARCNSRTEVAFQVPRESSDILLPDTKPRCFPYRISWSPRTMHKVLRLPPSPDRNGSKWRMWKELDPVLSFIRELPMQKLTIDIDSGYCIPSHRKYLRNGFVVSSTRMGTKSLLYGLQIPTLETTVGTICSLLRASLEGRLEGAYFEKIEAFPEFPFPNLEAKPEGWEQVDGVPYMIPLILGHQPLHGPPTPLPFDAITGLYLSPVDFLHTLDLEMETGNFHRYIDRLVKVDPRSMPGLVFYRSSGCPLQRFPTTSDGSRTDLAASQEWIVTLSQFDQQIIRELHERHPDFPFHLYLI